MTDSAIDQKVAVGVVFGAALFMSIMDTTIVNVALPSISHEFGIGAAAVEGVSIGFLVALAVCIPASAWLGDRFGGKPVLLGAIAVFTLASALCGVAWSLPSLVLFRILQGIGGGTLAPVGMTMLLRAFPPSQRMRASAILTVPITLAPTIGPVLGGVLVTAWSWRWVFYVNLPIGLAALLFGLLCLRNERDSSAGRFDLPGFLLSGAGLGLLLYGLTEWPQPHSGTAPPVCVALGVLLLATMVRVELRTREPLVELRVLTDRLFRSSTAALVCAAAAFFGTLYAVSLYFQVGLGLSPLASGLSTFPEAVGALCGGQLASRVLYARLGPRRHICLGLAATAVSIGLLALPTAATSLWWIRALLFCVGLSMVQLFTTTQTAAFAQVPGPATGRASAMFNAGRQLGSAVGVALLSAVLLIISPHSATDAANLTAYRVAFLTAAIVCLLGIVPALRIDDSAAANTVPPPPAAARSASESLEDR